MAELVMLRPWALLGLVPAAVVVWLLLRSGDPRRAWRGVIAEHLIPYLVRDGGAAGRRRRAWPVIALGVGLLLAVLAAAGPSFGRAPSPFTSDESVLVVVLSARTSMDERDVQPSRLERAVQKLGDLFDRRGDVRAGLVAYAGSAHPVVPPTRDVEVIAQLAAAVSTDVMPLASGDAAPDALKLAGDWIRRGGGAGSILWVTDACEATDDDVSKALGSAAAPVVVYAVTGGDVDGALRSSGALVTVTPDSRDVEQLDAAVGRALQAAPGENAVPRDDGYWLVFAVAACVLLWARKGWALPWS